MHIHEDSVGCQLKLAELLWNNIVCFNFKRRKRKGNWSGIPCALVLSLGHDGSNNRPSIPEFVFPNSLSICKRN